METAIGLMTSLKIQAKKMMAGRLDPASHFGPTFTYQPGQAPG